jgi:hypothetical protein
MADTPLISLVIVTYNRRNFVLKCLESCERQDYPRLEILVLDNASTDGTVDAVRERFRQARLFRIHKNLGPEPVRNLGIANAQGEYLMLLDDDTYFLQDDAVSRMLEVFRKKPELGLVCCNLEGPYEVPPSSSDRYLGTFMMGAALIPMRVFTEWVGYFPDSFFRAGGEALMATRLYDLGLPILQIASVRMYHDQTRTGRSMWHWAFYATRSELLVSIMRDPWFLIPPRLASKFLHGMILWGVRRGQFFGWLWAWFNVWLYVPEAIRNRQPVRWQTWRKLRRLPRW